MEHERNVVAAFVSTGAATALAAASASANCYHMMMPLSFLSPKTEVRESSIHGRGLFAVTEISKDEIVAVKGGHIVDRKTLR